MQQHKADFILIGGHAALLYGSERTTGDMNLLVKPTAENGQKIIQAFLTLGLEIDDLGASDFETNLVLTFGFEPDGVDIINRIKLTDFETVAKKAMLIEIEKELKIFVIDARDLLAEKRLIKREGRKGLSDQIDILGIEKYLEINRR